MAIETWRSATKGEDLLFLLASSFRRQDVLGPENFRPSIDYSRSVALSGFFAGAFLLNVFARSLRVGDEVVRRFGDSSETQLAREMRFELLSKLDLAESDLKDGAMGRIGDAVIAAVYASDRPISNGLRKLVKEEFPKPQCYACGKALGWRASAGLPVVSLDHVWPAAWGGDSVLENLLPACSDCNTSRNDLIGWQWVSAQALVGEHDSGSFLERLPRQYKNSIHLRAVVAYACSARVTLKDAAILIGPVLLEPQKIDERDTTDFFNLVAHDIDRYDPSWSRE
ncbi:HNH endonuclease [Dyella japonica]|uniref:HNH domain-containing protein n=1 Tax=Dyella japonica TaxID=231455 RepID=A0ABV2JWA5_9GAMM